MDEKNRKFIQKLYMWINEEKPINKGKNKQMKYEYIYSFIYILSFYILYLASI